MSIDVDELAQEIRHVDGQHKLGAGQLAEALMPFLARSVWRDISTARKDGTIIWAALRSDIFPSLRPERDDLKRWNGVQVPLSHPGVYERDGRTWDHGWNIAAPVGNGGFPDEWIAGWVPLPPPPSPSQENTNG